MIMNRFIFPHFNRGMPRLPSQLCSFFAGKPVNVYVSPDLLCIITLVANRCLPTVNPMISERLSSTSMWVVQEI